MTQSKRQTFTPNTINTTKMGKAEDVGAAQVGGAAAVH